MIQEQEVPYTNTPAERRVVLRYALSPASPERICLKVLTSISWPLSRRCYLSRDGKCVGHAKTNQIPRVYEAHPGKYCMLLPSSRHYPSNKAHIKGFTFVRCTIFIRGDRLCACLAVSPTLRPLPEQAPCRHGLHHPGWLARASLSQRQ